MDSTFVVRNATGDQIRIDLSVYDEQNIKAFSTDPLINSLYFYNISLERVDTKSVFINPGILFSACEALAKFLEKNTKAILSFYCDPRTDVPRSHLELSPQEYRSKLFTKLFEYYTISKNIDCLIHRVLVFNDTTESNNTQYFHLLGNKNYKEQIDNISNIVLDK